MNDERSRALPPPGWYEDPERPGTGWQRRWDGALWTDDYREAPKPGALTAPLIIGAAILILAAVASASLAANREDFETAETLGYVLGAIAFPLLIAYAARFAYVKLFARDQPVWTHWIVVAASVIGVLGLVGNAGRNAEDEELTEAADEARAACPGAQAFPPSAAGLAIRTPGVQATERALQAVPEPLRDYYEVRVVRAPGVRAAAIAAPLGGDIVFEDFRDGFASAVPGGLRESGQLPGGATLLTGSMAGGAGLSLWEADCFAYSVFTPDPASLKPLSRAIAAAVST